MKATIRSSTQAGLNCSRTPNEIRGLTLRSLLLSMRDVLGVSSSEAFPGYGAVIYILPHETPQNTARIDLLPNAAHLEVFESEKFRHSETHADERSTLTQYTSTIKCPLLPGGRGAEAPPRPTW